jgi:hypothetical protein
MGLKSKFLKYPTSWDCVTLGRKNLSPINYALILTINSLLFISPKKSEDTLIKSWWLSSKVGI